MCLLKPDQYPDEVQESVIQKLQNVLEKRKNLEEYQELYSESNTNISSLEEFQELPMISKEDLIGNSDSPEILMDKIRNNTVSCGATGGTTGNPTICLRTDTDIQKFTERMQKKPDNYFPKDSRTLVIVDHQLQNEMVESLKKTGRFVAIGHPNKLGFTVEIMDGLNIDTIYTYPSFALKLGKEFQRQGYDPSIIKRVVMGGEKLSELAKERLNHLFPDAKLSQTWGSTEQSRCGYQTEDIRASNAYRIYPDYHFHEIVDPETGEPVELGEVGELVTTTLWKNTGVPLIRYKTGDKAVMTYKPTESEHSDLVIEMKGRVKFDKVHMNGYKFFSNELEEALQPVSENIGGQYQVIIQDIKKEGNVVPMLNIRIVPVERGVSEEVLESKVMQKFEVEEEKSWKDAYTEGSLGPIKIEFVDEIDTGRLKTKKVVDKRTRT